MDIIDNAKDWVSEKANEFIHSERFLDWAQEEASPVIEQKLEAFLKDDSVKQKIHEYQQDPKLLEEDFLKFTGILDNIDKIFTILDIAAIIATVISALGTAGAAALGGAGVRVLLETVVKQGVRAVAKTIIKRVLAKIAAKSLKQYAVLGAMRFSAGVIREIGWRIAIHSALSGILHGLEAGGIAALIAAKDTIAKRGLEFGMPEDIVNKATKPDVDAKTFRSILDSYLEGIQSYVIKLVTTKTGLINLTIGGLASAIGAKKFLTYRAISDSYKQSYAAAKAGALTAATYSQQYGVREKLEKAQQIKQQLQELATDKKDNLNQEQEGEEAQPNIAKAVRSSALPVELHPSYIRMLTKTTLEHKPQEIQAIVEQQLRIANYRIAESVELLHELATLDVVQQLQKPLASARNESTLSELLTEITDLQVSADALLSNKDTGLPELVEDLREAKSLELKGLLQALALDSNENVKTLRKALLNNYNIDRFKQSLMENTQAVLV